MKNYQRLLFTFTLTGIITALLTIQTALAQVKAVQKWASDTTLRTPESVLYDAKKDILYVSNIGKINAKAKDGDGFISRLKPDGKIDQLNWVSGLNDPKGMGIYKNTLYVADLTQLVEIDIDKGTITNRYEVEKAVFLNDVTVDKAGTVYISDSEANKVYRFSQGKTTVWLDNAELNKPNGLLAEDKKVLVLSMNSGILKTVDPATNVSKDWVAELPSADGVVSDGKGNYLVSNWNGEVYFVQANGQKQKLLDTKEAKINAADIEYVVKTRTLFIPTFFNNRVVAYEVK